MMQKYFPYFNTKNECKIRSVVSFGSKLLEIRGRKNVLRILILRDITYYENRFPD